jgi:predicted nucleic acid-binding protein
MIVIADTTPLNYLVLIGHADILPVLYGRVLIPRAVYLELQHERTPDVVRVWIAHPPSWLEIRTIARVQVDIPDGLDPGEAEAITLAEEIKADLLIVDDRAARVEAVRRHLTVLGTLRVLSDAAEADLLDLPTALAKLQQTTFRADSTLIQNYLDRDAERKKRRTG